MFRITLLSITIGAAAFGLTATPARAIDEDHYRTAREMSARAIAWLRTQQDAETGGWSVSTRGPQLPAITGLVVQGMLMDPRIDRTDTAVARGIEYILRFRQPDGGIYDRILASYNTAICLSALALVHTPESAEAIIEGQRLLRSLQWSENPGDSRETGRVDPDHPFYGGIGYGNHGRPDNSNLQLALQAMHDTGVKADDAIFQRALLFLQRTQNLESVNDQPYAKGMNDGGFIYSTSPDSANVGAGESKAGESDAGATTQPGVSGLRSYGSMTYGGFKSYIYADLDRDDPRVNAAYDWIRRNYTLDENPGIGNDGLYYYFITFARALDAWGLPTITTADEDGSNVEMRDWANDLIARLSELQNEDGSFRSIDDRWMENNPVLITAYSLIALQYAIK